MSILYGWEFKSFTYDATAFKKCGSFIYVRLIININNILEISIVCILVNTINELFRNLCMLSYRFLKSEVF